jgi:hypothetical protein
MTEQELRALVRDAIARHWQLSAAEPRPDGGAGRPVTMLRAHLSHAQFVLPAGMDTDGPCLIEPAVQCNHCGFCKSYGH